MKTNAKCTIKKAEPTSLDECRHLDVTIVEDQDDIQQTFGPWEPHEEDAACRLLDELLLKYELRLVTCSGITVKTGKRCRKDFEVFPNGYCKYHQNQVPSGSNVKQCQGTASTTGEQCRKNWDVAPNGYCGFHLHQAPNGESVSTEPEKLYTKKSKCNTEYQSGARRCLGTAFSTGERCRINWDVSSNGYCEFHQSQAPKS